MHQGQLASQSSGPIRQLSRWAGKSPDFDSEIAGFHPKQMEAVRALDTGLIKFLLYGGALGGGKSHFLRFYGLRRLIFLHQFYNLQSAVGMLACEDYPSLKDRQLQKIAVQFPRWIGKLHEDHKVYGRCFILYPKWGGGVLCFRNLDDPSKYASAEFAFILVDELTKNTIDVFDQLRHRLRWPGLPDIECQFVAGSNPGSVGHGWVKAFWMDELFPPEWISPVDFRSQFAYVQSLADDNPHLETSYWTSLETLPEHLRKAFRYGNWDVFLGQAFPQLNAQIHKIAPIPIPDWAPLYFTFDWGFAKPFSIGWWWIDADGRAYRHAEWYGWNGTPNQGLRLTDPEIALGIIEREKNMGIWGKGVVHLASHDCFNKKPDYRGGGQGPSTAEEFAKYGIYLVKADVDRRLKIRQFNERIRVPDDGTLPMMLIYNTCVQFWRTVTSLQMDPNKPEDVDSDMEDHAYDEACQIAMMRPLAMRIPERRKSEYDRRIERMEKMHRDEYTEYASREQRETIRHLLRAGRIEPDDEDYGYEDRGGMIETTRRIR